MKKTAIILAALSLQASWAHQHHHHNHSEKAVLASQGIFDDADVEDRALSDWEGDWQSIYPYLVNGDLDQVLAVKAEKGDKTLEEYRAYYLNGYKTDLTLVKIHGDQIEFIAPNQTAVCEYKYSGKNILNYDSGKKGVRYQFECIDAESKAPKYIQFSDHIIAPEKAGHFHLYMGNDSHETLALELSNWPTFYPASFSKEEIVDEMIGHDSHGGHGAHQHGVANMNISIEHGNVELELDGALANFISFEYAPQSDAEIAEVKAMANQLNAIDQLFVLPKDANCALKDLDLVSDVIEPQFLGQKTHTEAHKNHNTTHGNLMMTAQWQCQMSTKLQQLNVKLFEYFPNLEHVEVQMITPNGQKSAELSRKNSVIQW